MLPTLTMMKTAQSMDQDVDSIVDKLLQVKCWTHGDEALVITLLANNIKVLVSRHLKQPRNTATTRFTKVVVTLEGNKKKTTKEWSMEGVSYYNTRIKAIHEKFEEESAFDIKLMKSLCQDIGKKPARKTIQDERSVYCTIFDSAIDKL